MLPFFRAQEYDNSCPLGFQDINLNFISFVVVHNFGGVVLDITVQRILSLIPKKEDGKYVYGAKKKFAESIGYVGGEIVTMWESGSSKSYMGKLYEISAVYNVSVEWLRGETDDPAPAGQKEKPTPVSESGLSPLDERLNELLSVSSDETKRLMIDLLEKMQKR